MPLYLVTGKVTRTDDSGTRTVGEGSIVKEGPDAQTLKEQWETAMRQIFRDGPTDTVDFHCLVVPADKIPPRLPVVSDPRPSPAWDPLNPLAGREGQRALRAWGAVAWTNLLRLLSGRKPI